MMKTFGGLRVAVAVLAIIYILIPLIVVIPASFTSANYPSFPAEGFHCNGMPRSWSALNFWKHF